MSHDCRHRNCETPCERELPEVKEMLCPEEQFFYCKEEMTRSEMFRHYTDFHGKATLQDIEDIFEEEAERRSKFR